VVGFLLSIPLSVSCLLSVGFLLSVSCLPVVGRFLLSVFRCRFPVVGSPLSVFYCRFPVVGFLSIFRCRFLFYFPLSVFPCRFSRCWFSLGLVGHYLAGCLFFGLKS